MRNSVIAQNRVVQMRYNKMLREMIFAQNCAKCFYFAQRFYAQKQNFAFRSAKVLRLKTLVKGGSSFNCLNRLYFNKSILYWMDKGRGGN